MTRSQRFRSSSLSAIAISPYEPIKKSASDESNILANDRESERREKKSAGTNTAQFRIKTPAGSFSLVPIYGVSMKSVNKNIDSIEQESKRGVANVLAEREAS